MRDRMRSPSNTKQVIHHLRQARPQTKRKARCQTRCRRTTREWSSCARPVQKVSELVIGNPKTKEGEPWAQTPATIAYPQRTGVSRAAPHIAPTTSRDCADLDSTRKLATLSWLIGSRTGRAMFVLGDDTDDAAVASRASSPEDRLHMQTLVTSRQLL